MCIFSYNLLTLFYQLRIDLPSLDSWVYSLFVLFIIIIIIVIVFIIIIIVIFLLIIIVIIIIVIIIIVIIIIVIIIIVIIVIIIVIIIIIKEFDMLRAYTSFKISTIRSNTEIPLRKLAARTL